MTAATGPSEPTGAKLDQLHSTRTVGQMLRELRDRGVLQIGDARQPPELLQEYAELAIKAGKPVEAGWALHFLQERLGYATALPEQLQLAALAYHPFWSNPVRGRRCVLRRPEPGHLPYLEAILSDSRFMAQYNAFIGNGKAAAAAFVARVRVPPLRSRQVDWVVESANGTPIGLGCLADMDLENQRAELLVGFPEANPREAVEAALQILVVGFHYLKLRKIVSYVYGGNDAAQAAAMHLGFVQEGYLRSHVRHRHSGNRSDLYLNGMLREDYLRNVTLARIGQRTVAPWYPAGLVTMPTA